MSETGADLIAAAQGALKYAEAQGLTDATFWVRDLRAALQALPVSASSVEARRTEFNLGAGFDKQQGGDEQSPSSGGESQ